ncbi:Cellobiose dehydrogenase [Cytospora mali]|uniref:Cellobiose dehydrogenase n=1 Tax=Cytospora mali TaxID=578113 RepID=A0A194V0W0_CYTMA|nr:Cellobiose dehydrogenase [Valsa mali var. pyri (nom. inval.)]
MHVLPPTLTALILSILGSTAVSAASTGSDGNPEASTYTDSNTNITFLGYANEGFQFGMALPSDPKDDLLIQLVSPLKNGGGWAGVDFGEYMVPGHLMFAAWPNTAKENTVLISPRIATGYDVSNGANVYKANPITITQIPDGTFVNDTHVSATFVCGGCLNSDSFSGSNKTATFSYAYAYDAVADPSDVDTQLSDHTANGEPYGPFDVTIAQAESSEYQNWAALTTPASATATAAASTSTGAAAAAGTGSSSSSGSSSSGSGGSSSSSSSTSSSSSSSDVVDEPTGFSAGGIFALVGVGLIYVLKAVQIL